MKHNFTDLKYTLTRHPLKFVFCNKKIDSIPQRNSILEALTTDIVLILILAATYF